MYHQPEKTKTKEEIAERKAALEELKKKHNIA